MSSETSPAESPNPFAPPRSVDPFYSDPSGSSSGIYRKGNVLVVHKQAQLPARCVKSNEPTSLRLKRKLSWHHPAIFLVILFNLLIYVVIALLVRKTAVLHIGLAERFHQRRRRNMLIAWAIALTGIVMFVVGLAYSDTPGQSSPLMFGLVLGPITLFLGLLWGLYGCRVVYPKRIDDDYVWLRGVCPEYLAEYDEPPFHR